MKIKQEANEENGEEDRNEKRMRAKERLLEMITYFEVDLVILLISFILFLYSSP